VKTPVKRSLALALALGSLLALPVARGQGDDDDDEKPKKPAKPEPEAKKKDPDALPEDPLERSQALLARGRHDEAQELARALAERDPKALAPRVVLASILLKTGRDLEAETATKELVTLGRTDMDAHLLRGRLLEMRGELDAADAEYELAVALAPDAMGFEAKVRLAGLRRERGKKKEASALLAKVLSDYEGRDALAPEEFAWVARACRLLDYDETVKGEYARSMSAYTRQMLDQALDKDPRCVPALVTYGELYLDKGDVPAATAAFEKAVKSDPNEPAARTGLARALEAAFYKGSGRYADLESEIKKALAVDPNYPLAHAALAQMAVTEGDPDRALARCEQALPARPWNVDLHAAKAASLLFKGDDAGFAAEEKALLEKYPTCARFYNEIALMVSMKFRYKEARDLAQKALALDPGYYPARATLGLNLLRTGDEPGGREQLKQAFKDDPYDVVTFNTLELMDRLERDYTTIETANFVIRLHKKEAPASARYVTALLDEARSKLTKRYGVELKRKTLVELFPRAEDFSARSIGLPFIPALGICFGDVVTVISANERVTFGKHSWGRTLWHEYTHVCTLNRTKNRIPRWLTEGLSVYEESRGRPSWVREYDVPILTLRARGLILPLSTFDEGFTKPRFPDQVMMSYYQGGLACEFLETRFGFPKILALLDEYAKGEVTKEAVPAALGVSLEEFDKQFLEFLEERYAGIAYVPPPSDEEKDALLDRVAEAPWDVAARGALARDYALMGKVADAEAQAGAALSGARTLRFPAAVLSLDEEDAFPGPFVRAGARATWIRAGSGDACLALGIVAQDRGKDAEALKYFRQALALGTRDPVEAHRRRANIFRVEKRWRQALDEYRTCERLLPPVADIHRVIAACSAASGDEATALAELDKACALDSDDLKTRLEVAALYRKKDRWADVARVLDDAPLIDPFEPNSHFLLAEALRNTGKLERALGEYDAALDADKDGALTLKPVKLADPVLADVGASECLLALGRRDEAQARAKKALERDPDQERAKKVVEEVEKSKADGKPK
jgi:tetratricopeptide (TPR) repeat protein